ncbi:galactose mutarotase [Bacteroides sp. 214]|uniref:aldose epimerase family protein n=1 Tax=Bacteroides sp. 214 TaxID=2302935 RepID=UPI0013D765C7|nr:aldose epimerase family protein [Bacteroides sp. 214]NDW11363.1 galactose mutarotase [Bacteroides sp. 214]
MKREVVLAGIIALVVSSCNTKPASELTQSGLDPKNFQTEIKKEPVALYTLKNENGMEVCITNFGGRIVSIMVPDMHGEMKDVVLGFDNINSYQNVPSDFGAAIGRYANRIKDAKMTIDSKDIQLLPNNFGHCLHGGPEGWQYKVYTAKPISDTQIAMIMQSPDNDMNFPGNVTATVTYTLTEDNAIDIQYEATTDQTTVINMTNHSYFNLSGDATKEITSDILYINADSYTPVDATYMTTGEILPVADTPMDFSKLKMIGEDIDKFDFEQLKNGNGYDHNWVLNTAGDITKLAARVTSPASGISVEVYTDEPGIQVYTGNFLDGTAKGKKGIMYKKRTGICLETQHYPDSPNKPQWPSVLLKPGETYKSHCIYKFTAEKP